MGNRVNLRNFENGEQMAVKSWKKQISRHCQDWTKQEMVEEYGHIPSAIKEIEKHFSPYLIGDEVWINPENGWNSKLLGEINAAPDGFRAIANTKIAEYSAILNTQDEAIQVLHNLYKNIAR